MATATAFHRPPPAIRIATIGTVSATTPGRVRDADQRGGGRPAEPDVEPEPADHRGRQQGGERALGHGRQVARRQVGHARVLTGGRPQPEPPLRGEQRRHDGAAHHEDDQGQRAVVAAADLRAEDERARRRPDAEPGARRRPPRPDLR
ncbi:hypothetical protein [Actinomadura madurae]|uniref:hypothetical protein n=1 Tax=Actinomadura madurae TaxID=1993 RepID=UPI0020D21F43|nr:hypothetical protein [Actinomadura madurae]MCP9983025.1 hypothetical protein [Actinomadura madurae]